MDRPRYIATLAKALLHHLARATHLDEWITSLGYFALYANLLFYSLPLLELVCFLIHLSQLLTSEMTSFQHSSPGLNPVFSRQEVFVADAVFMNWKLNTHDMRRAMVKYKLHRESRSVTMSRSCVTGTPHNQEVSPHCYIIGTSFSQSGSFFSCQKKLNIPFNAVSYREESKLARM